MIGYVTLGTNDLDRAAEFYDAVLATINGSRMMEEEGFIAWTTAPGAPGLAASKPFDGKTATVGNGTMVALQVDSPEAVTKLYEKAIELGAEDEGAPGPRGDTGFYAGYFRDLDGNKLNAFCITE